MNAPKACFKILLTPIFGRALLIDGGAGTRRHGERLCENFARAEEAQHRHTELEREFHAANSN